MSPKIVLIIGNGFDLDLGLKTSYSHFIESGFLRGIRLNMVIEQIKRSYSKLKWIDIEETLKEYSIAKSSTYNTNEIIEAHQILRDRLLQYLKQISYDNLDKQSSAIKILSTVLNDPDIKIFSFNYTDLQEIACKCDLRTNFIYTSIHGKLADNSIILGFEDEADVKSSELCQLIKSHSPYYRSANINQALKDADEIIFFGHSLGTTDYHYFRNFFLDQVQEQNKEDFTPKRIRVFTCDENSRLRILLQIRNMNSRKTNALYDLNDFQVYRTVSDGEMIDRYCIELQHRIKEPLFF